MCLDNLSNSCTRSACYVWVDESTSHVPTQPARIHTTDKAMWNRRMYLPSAEDWEMVRNLFVSSLILPYSNCAYPQGDEETRDSYRDGDEGTYFPVRQTPDLEMFFEELSGELGKLAVSDSNVYVSEVLAALHYILFLICS